MKVAIDARPLEKEYTGVGNYIVNLIEGLKQNNIEVTLLYSSKPQIMIPNYNYEILPSKNRFYWEQFILPRFLSKNKFDLYHATWNYGLPLFSKVRFILTVHDIIPIKWPRYFWGRQIGQLPVYCLSLFISLVRSNRVITDSQNTLNDLCSYFPFIRSKSEVIYLGVDKPNLSNQTTNIFESKYIIYFGGIDKRKNIDGLIDAYVLSKTSKDTNLVIVGKHSDIFKEKINKLDFSNKITCIGYVSNEEKFALIKNSKLLVYPSYYEGFGIPPLEAMSVGTPVIVSNKSCLPEIVGDAGYYVNPDNQHQIADGIDRVIDDEQLRNQLIRNGLSRIGNFTWEKMVTQTIQMYNKILK